MQFKLKFTCSVKLITAEVSNRTGVCYKTFINTTSTHWGWERRAANFADNIFKFIFLHKIVYIF